MESESLSQRKAQLDKEEREHLEDVVTEMRDRVEDNVEFQLTQRGLDDKPEDIDSLDEDTQQLVEAIELEAVDGETWSEAFDQYVTGVGYTIVNRLAALRCMEVRGFIDEEVTVFKDNGLTPAAETLVHEEFLLEDEAILEAYHNACDDLAEEIEILFDRSSAYSLIDPDDDTFEELCGKLDSIDDEVWRADDVLGWVYEYYNVKLLDDLRRKGDREGLEPEDVPPANQFYTPHWVVRMLTDNSLGKLYLEHTGDLQNVVEAQEDFSPDERKSRPLSPDESPDIADFCTYLVPSEEEGEPTDFDHPEELRVIDPACGSGHFLLYAFDVLERIWRAETGLPDVEIPRKILQHNLYGVDLDMRACQLAAFNLYLKGRTRAEAEGADGFEMPEVGIVCADASIAEVDGVEAVFDEVAGDDPEVQQALERILDAFEEVHGLGSLLDVRGTLGDLFEDDADIGGTQLTLGDDPRESHTLGQVLHSLREAVEEQREGDSFLAQDLRSFVRLLDILAQDYDVALMNPPYGSQNRMPDSVEEYVETHYDYPTEFYINFFEVCDRITKEHGAIGMLVPRSFMFKQSYQQFRTDFLGKRGRFDFLTEFGLGILDNATVRTAGTVVRTDSSMGSTGTFFRLQDLESDEKEGAFLQSISPQYTSVDIQRYFTVSLEELAAVPGTPISYSTPSQVRQLHRSELKIDADKVDGGGYESVSTVRAGLQTGNNTRFIRKFWDSGANEERPPIAKGGSNAWTLPKVMETVEWGEAGQNLKRASGSVVRNEPFYGREGLTWTYIKSTGRRFGYYPANGVFSHTGFMLFPKESYSTWAMMAMLNSDLYLSLFLSITTERHWNVGEVGRMPWIGSVDVLEELAETAREQYRAMLQLRQNDPTSPYYRAPPILTGIGQEETSFYKHPHSSSARDVVHGLSGKERYEISADCSITEATRNAMRQQLSVRQELENKASKIDSLIYDSLEITDETIDRIHEEIFLRTSENPEDREVPDPESVPEVPENVDDQVKDLVHHFAMEAVREEDDGIIPLHGLDEQPNMLDRIVERFEVTYGEHAEDRLVEVDEILGAESAAEEAYPNLRQWVAEGLFDYHVSRMENTPIVWKLTTERLLAE